MSGDLFPLDHVPVHPARPCTPGEGIYLRLWQEWATNNPKAWAAIFGPGEPTQRTATVAASFMVFMGCNGGAGFADAAERIAQSAARYSRGEAFLAAWAIENARSAGINNGLRTIEYMLAEQYPIEHELGARVNWDKVPEVTMRDIDTVESMVLWWSTGVAAEIRHIAEPMIDGEKRKRLSSIFGRETGSEA